MKYSPKLLPALPLLALVFFWPHPARAVPQTWLGSNGDYKVSGNWSGNVVPGSGTSVLVDSGTANITSSETGTTGTLTIGLSGTGVVTVNGGIFVDTSGVVLGANSGANGTLNVTNAGTWQPEGPGGSTSVIVGQSGVGTLNFTGGSINVTGGESITLGANAGGSGTFNASSGTMQFTGSGTLNVGASGTGALVVNGADLQVINADIGLNTTGSGSASVSSGTLAVQTFLNVGASGTGVLNVNGGYASYNNTSNIGQNAGSNGTVNVTSGTLQSSSNLNIGLSGTGALVISGGMVSDFSATISANAGGSGSVSVTGGTFNSSSSTTVGGSGTGTLTVNGGYLSRNVTLGGSAGSSGTMNVISGTAAVGHLVVGQGGSGAVTVNGGYMSMGDVNIENGIVTVNSGTLSMGNDSQVSYLGSSSGTLQMNGGLFTSAVGLPLGTSGSASGTVVVSGGTFQMTGSGFIIGEYGIGTLTVNGGYLSSFDGAFGFGGGQGSAVVSSGTWAATSITLGSGSLNLTGSGVVTMQSGTGTFYLEGSGILNIGTGGQAGTLNAAKVSWQNSGTGTINFNHAGTTVFTPDLDGESGIVLNNSGPGTTILTGTSIFLSGTGINISAGTLQVGNGGAGPVFYSPGVVNNSSLVFDTSGTFTPDSVISGTGTVQQAGPGVSVLTHANTYSGSTIVSQGTLLLDFSQFGPSTNIINNTATNSGLLLAGGTLGLTGSSAASNIQDFNGLTINAGASSIIMTQNGAADLVLNLGAITRNTGGLLNIVPPTTGLLLASSGTDAFGLLPGVTISGSNWATLSSGRIIALTSYTQNSNVATWGANQNIATNAAVYSGSHAGALTINSLKIDTAGSNNINFGQLSVTDGILQTSTMSYFNNTVISGGTLSGAAGRDLVVINNGAGTGSLIIVSAIADNTSATGLTIGGTSAGGVTLGGTNTYTGITTVTQGTLQIGTGSATSSLGTGAVVDNGTLIFFPAAPLGQDTTVDNAISGSGNAQFSYTTYAGLDTSSGTTTVNYGKLAVTGTISPSASLVVSTGGTLAGTGQVGGISGGGRVAPGGNSILTASQADPTSGMSYAFHFSGTGSPNYNSPTASGNDVLHLTSATPLVSALTSANTIAVDFTGLVLQSGQIYYGGFFTDAAIANSMVQNATFSYTGLGGATVQFEGMATVASAPFATGTVSNGEVMQFDVTQGPPVPAAPPWATALAGAGLFITLLAMRGRIAGRVVSRGMSRLPTRPK